MTLPASLPRRLRRGALALAAAALVAACGGGTSQVDAFEPAQMFAFGDEYSLLTEDGRKYSVNALDDDDAVDCAAQPIWTQAVATFYDLVFAECNPDDEAETRALMHAELGARAEDLRAQIDAVEAGSGFGADAVATVLVGAHDVLDLYAEFPARSQAELTADARARGELIAEQVNRLVALDVRVLIATVPDMGLTPFALAEKAAHTDVDRAVLLTRLTEALNAELRVTIVNDGRQLGLVLADEMTQAIVKSPSSFSIANATVPACTVALPDCSSDTLIADAESNTRLWADDLRFAYGGQYRLGVLAQNRARNNPF